MNQNGFYIEYNDRKKVWIIAVDLTGGMRHQFYRNTEAEAQKLCDELNRGKK